MAWQQTTCLAPAASFFQIPGPQNKPAAAPHQKSPLPPTPVLILGHLQADDTMTGCAEYCHQCHPATAPQPSHPSSSPSSTLFSGTSSFSSQPSPFRPLITVLRSCSSLRKPVKCLWQWFLHSSALPLRIFCIGCLPHIPQPNATRLPPSVTTFWHSSCQGHFGSWWLIHLYMLCFDPSPQELPGSLDPLLPCFL